MIVFAVFGLLLLVPGALGYSGLWRSWTGRDRDRSTLFGVFWAGIGFGIATVAELIPADGPRGTGLLVGLIVIVLGGVLAFWTPPPHAALVPGAAASARLKANAGLCGARSRSTTSPAAGMILLSIPAVPDQRKPHELRAGSNAHPRSGGGADVTFECVGPSA